MAEYKAGGRQAEPLHPGRIIQSSLDELNLSARAAAIAIGVTPQAFGNVLAGSSAVSPDMALRLGRFFDTGPEVWINMQRDHDLWHAGRRLKDELAKIRPAKDAAA